MPIVVGRTQGAYPEAHGAEAMATAAIQGAAERLRSAQLDVTVAMPLSETARAAGC
jgi:hypothetical protein